MDDTLPARNLDLSAMARERAAPVVDWVLAERRRVVRTTRFMHDYCIALRDVGVPVDRATFHIRTLHPQLAAITTLWNHEAGGAVELGREHGIQDTPLFLNSPVRPVYETGEALRRKLDAGIDLDEFTILRELHDQGYRDYTVRPLHFTTGEHAAHSFATRRPEGFSDLDLATMDALLPALSVVLELNEMRRTARHLLDTYVGRQAGNRVLRGRIRRGEGEVIEAVIWLCDLRGFSKLAEDSPLEEVMRHLNTYFDTIGGPIQRHGGEILKFIGDAILAIFPSEPGESDMRAACGRAAAAAREALAARDALNARRNIVGCPAFDCGIALHVGEVMYGNIGAADRLDFTVIGPSVNLAARLEGLTAEIEQPVVVSETFARLTDMTCQPLGTFSLRGVARPQTVYGLENRD